MEEFRLDYGEALFAGHVVDGDPGPALVAVSGDGTVGAAVAAATDVLTRLESQIRDEARHVHRLIVSLVGTMGDVDQAFAGSVPSGTGM